MKIEIEKTVLFQLMVSHSELAQAEYNRNTSYNSSHFSHKAEDAIVDALDLETMQEFMEYQQKNPAKGK